jgi:GT2 family glycosyltransferase
MALLVGIVVVNWNGARRTSECVRSLLALDYEPFKVCVVDNGSEDDSAGELRREFPGVDVLELRENRGYGGGCNAGIEWARRTECEYVWLLNNDTTIDGGCLRALTEAAREHGDGSILAPLILRSDDPRRVWSAGGVVRWPWLEREHIGMGDDEATHQAPRAVDWASGCSLFFSMMVADRVGPFDERYFLYLEDVEWCLRAHKRGVSCWFTPQARLWHDVSESVLQLHSRVLHYYASRNYVLLATTHGGPIGRTWAYGRLLLTLGKAGVRLALFPSYRHDTYYRAQVDGLFDFLRRRFGKAGYHDERAPAAAAPKERMVS